MSNALADLASTLTQRAEIGAEDVLALRRLVWADGGASREEADAIMALNSVCRVRSAEWVDYLVEVICDFCIHQQKPAGYIDDGNAAWLMRWIDHDGKVDSLTELELLVRILEVATSVPASLKTYALNQIETAVLTGEGPTRKTGLVVANGDLSTAGINATEVELLRRIVFAVAGDSGLVVGRDEAEMLFRLKDATLNTDNAPGWSDLFVKCVGNHLMAHSSYQSPSRDEQLKQDAYVADTAISFWRFARRAIRMQVDGGLPETSLSAPDRANDDAARAASQAVTPNEKTWLNGQIQADGATDALEVALLDFIKRESASSASA